MPRTRPPRAPEPHPSTANLVRRLFLALWCIGCVAQGLLSILPVLLPMGNADLLSGIPLDKVLHALGFGLLGVLTPLAFRRGAPLLLGLGLLGLLTLGSEYVQQLVPWRTFSLGDLLADFVGMVPGLWLGLHLEGRLFGSPALRS